MLHDAACDLLPSMSESEAELRILVERAITVTQASGAAIVLATDGGFICCASIGSAPEVGVRIQTESGLTAASLCTGAIVCCADSDFDPRVDPAVCRQLNLRSLAIVPIIYDTVTRGVIECFWSVPQGCTDSRVAEMCHIAESVAQLVYSPGPAASEPPVNTLDEENDRTEYNPYVSESAISSAAVPEVHDPSPLAINELLQEENARARRWSETRREDGLTASVVPEPFADRPEPACTYVEHREAPSRRRRAMQHLSTRLHPPNDPTWIGGLFIVGIVVLLACIMTFLYLWVEQAESAGGRRVLLQSEAPTPLQRCYPNRQLQSQFERCISRPMPGAIGV